MAAMPLTANGKVNRKALPRPDLDSLTTMRTYVAPRTEVEQKLAEIWADVLRLERVGVHDDIFEMGGDSLMIDLQDCGPREPDRPQHYTPCIVSEPFHRSHL
jgi:hypothetical protein